MVRKVQFYPHSVPTRASRIPAIIAQDFDNRPYRGFNVLIEKVHFSFSLPCQLPIILSALNGMVAVLSVVK
jgi:hypothetical protein